MIISLENRSWEQPLYPEFPRGEYDDRIRRAKKYMADQNIDVLVLWDINNIRYFTGFQSLHWSCMTLHCAVVLIPIDDDPIIIVPDFFFGVAEGYTFLRDIRLLHHPHVTAHLRGLPKDVADVVKELGYSRGRIGIEAGFLGGMAIPRPINDIDSFRHELSGADFVPAADDVIWKCRVIKSPAEIEALKKATEAVVKSYSDLMASFEWGWTEKDVGQYIRSRALEYTDDCPPPQCMATSRRVPMPDVPAFDEGIVLVPGDRIALEPFPTYKGYYGSCARCFHFGPITDEVLQKTEVVDRARESAIASVKPGIKTREIMDTINETMQEDGMICVIDQGGHGVGLSFQEPPAIALGEEFVVEEGMALAVECWYSEPGDMSQTKALYGGEDYVVVTEDGHYRMPFFKHDTYCLG